MNCQLSIIKEDLSEIVIFYNKFKNPILLGEQEACQIV